MKEDLILKKLEILDTFYKDYKEFKKTTTASLLNIENTMSIYNDMYQMNRDDIKDLKSRMSVVEFKLGI